jgi:hypothetical protein
MIESPMLKELMAENTRRTTQSNIVQILVERFGREARALRASIKAIEDDKQLTKLFSQAVKCPDIESFQKLLKS